MKTAKSAGPGSGLWLCDTVNKSTPLVLGCLIFHSSLSSQQLHDHHLHDRGDGRSQRSAALEEEGAGRGEITRCDLTSNESIYWRLAGWRGLCLLWACRSPNIVNALQVCFWQAEACLENECPLVTNMNRSNLQLTLWVFCSPDAEQSLLFIALWNDQTTSDLV